MHFNIEERLCLGPGAGVILDTTNRYEGQKIHGSISVPYLQEMPNSLSDLQKSHSAGAPLRLALLKLEEAV